MLCRLKCSLPNPCIFLLLSRAKFLKNIFYHNRWKTLHWCFCEQQCGFFVALLSFLNTKQCESVLWQTRLENLTRQTSVLKYTWKHLIIKQINQTRKKTSNKTHLLPCDGYPFFFFFFPLILYQRAAVQPASGRWLFITFWLFFLSFFTDFQFCI